MLALHDDRRQTATPNRSQNVQQPRTSSSAAVPRAQRRSLPALLSLTLWTVDTTCDHVLPRSHRAADDVSDDDDGSDADHAAGIEPAGLKCVAHWPRSAGGTGRVFVGKNGPMAPTVAQIAAASTEQAMDVVDAMGTAWVAQVVGVTKESGVPMVLVAEFTLPERETGRSVCARKVASKINAIVKLIGGNDVWANRAAATSETSVRAAASLLSSTSTQHRRKTTKWLDHLISSLLASSISSDLTSTLFGTAALRHHPAARDVALYVDTLLLHAQAQSWFPCTTMAHDPYAGVADGLAMVLLADDMVLTNQLPPELVESVITTWRVVSKCPSLASMFLDDRSDHTCFAIPLAGLAAHGTTPGSLVVHTHLDMTLLAVLDASPVNPAIYPTLCARLQKVLQDVASLDLQRARVAVDMVPAMASKRAAPAWPKSAVTKTMEGGPKRSSTRAKVLGGSGERSALPTDPDAAAPSETGTVRAARGPEMRLTAGLHNALANYTYAPDVSATAEHVSSSTDPAWMQRCQSLAHLPRVSVHSRRSKTWTHRYDQPQLDCAPD
ncbi:hypothetical protein GGF32_000943 [Allomyces javanicus]|nr:hypothetical protein GGF32_000943 [Allomyces javanicus]